MSDCKCIIWHPQTEEERAWQRENFERARNYGDMNIAMMYLASLAGPCLTKEEQ
mgnify:CR=1 FL=1